MFFFLVLKIYINPLFYLLFIVVIVIVCVYDVWVNVGACAMTLCMWRSEHSFVESVSLLSFHLFMGFGDQTWL